MNYRGVVLAFSILTGIILTAYFMDRKEKVCIRWDVRNVRTYSAYLKDVITVPTPICIQREP